LAFRSPWRSDQAPKEFIKIDDFQHYMRCRIQLHAKGIVLRDIIEGARIKTKEQQVCRAGEFLVAEIDAKVGGFGIVPENLDGAIVSSHYFLFEIDQETLDKGFLDYYIRTPTFRDQVSARGTTNYAANRPQQVLEYSIPLPPFPSNAASWPKSRPLPLRLMRFAKFSMT
jgi:type I restriction enzyme, S subunit